MVGIRRPCRHQAGQREPIVDSGQRSVDGSLRGGNRAIRQRQLTAQLLRTRIDTNQQGLQGICHLLTLCDLTGDDR
jgi:hypothetical protein